MVFGVPGKPPRRSSQVIPFVSAVQYVRALDEILAEHSGPVVIFEEIESLADTMRYVERLEPAGDRYFVRTCIDQATPCEMEWSDVSSFLVKIGSPYPRMMGGQLNRYPLPPREGDVGCLGGAAQQLYTFGLRPTMSEFVFQFHEFPRLASFVPGTVNIDLNENAAVPQSFWNF